MKRERRLKTDKKNVSPDADVSDVELKQFGLTQEGEEVYQHPWKLSRGDCVLKQLKNKNLRNIADIGVNDMFYTKKAKSFASKKVYAVDVFFPEDGAKKDDIICVNDIEKLPNGEFDAIIMMDVLEHIDNDKKFFDTAVNKLKSGATILITVPAWQFLFSAHDKKCRHYRRYDRKQLLKLFEHNDIKVERCHYFYTSLFFARLVCLLFKKNKFKGNESGSWKYGEKNIITSVIRTILNLDYLVGKTLDMLGLHLPGLSLIAVCRKK